MRLRYILGAATVVALVAVAGGLTGHEPRAVVAAEPAATSAATADDAVRAAIEARGGQYAGDCATMASPRDLGKVCSRLAGENGDARAYLVGGTFSEFTDWVFVAPDASGWRIVGVAPLDFFGPPEPPWP